MIRTLVISCLVISCLVVSAAAARERDHDPTVVVTDAGAIKGSIASDGLRSFLGVPYAAPPVGELRWRAPRPATPWRGVIATTAPAPGCAQQPTPYSTASNAEDCLYLNVFSPAGATFNELVPVMVFIHGGSFAAGNAEMLNVATLADKGDVVTVSIQYRLGQLGFLAHPALADEPGNYGEGNYGFLDQQAALAWVQRNIAAFGGDPNQVTLFGQSAGGMSVSYHQISPGSAHLFHRAIIESAPTLLDPPPTLAQAEVRGENLAAAVGCTSGSPAPTESQIAACLRAAPLLTPAGAPTPGLLQVEPNGLLSTNWMPVVDGQILPLAPGEAYRSGEYKHVPLVIGGTHDEARLGIGLLIAEGVDLTSLPYEFLVDLAFSLPLPPATPSPLTALLMQQYPLSAYPSAVDAVAAAGSDSFTCGTHALTEITGTQDRVFAYEFNDPNAPPLFPIPNFSWKAYHLSELQYLAEQPYSSQFTQAQSELAEQMIGYWSNFAWHGHPEGRPHWTRYDPSGDNILSLAPEATAFTSNFVTDHQCAFWNALGFYQ